jgi:hypothetical protein
MLLQLEVNQPTCNNFIFERAIETLPGLVGLTG